MTVIAYFPHYARFQANITSFALVYCLFLRGFCRFRGLPHDRMAGCTLHGCPDGTPWGFATTLGRRRGRAKVANNCQVAAGSVPGLAAEGALPQLS